MDWNEKLDEFFREKDLSQKMVGEMIGVGKSAISKMLAGNQKLTHDILIALLKAFPDLDIRQIMLGENEDSSSKVEPQGSQNERALEELETVYKKLDNIKLLLSQK